MGGGVFVSYRREDAQGSAGRLYDRLSIVLGRSAVFFDVDNIDPGVDFVEVLGDRVGSCDVLLAVIGNQWITIKDDRGQRRIDNPNDFVRVEVEAALERKVPVIPVLVDGARMPRAEDLPETLKSLARRQAAEVSHARFDFDADRLLKALRRSLDERHHVQQERLRQAELEAIRLAKEEEQHRVEAEALRSAEEDRQRADVEAARVAELERQAAEFETARLAEEAHRQVEAEALRLAEEVRNQNEAEVARVAEQNRREAEAAGLAEEALRYADSEAGPFTEDHSNLGEAESIPIADLRGHTLDSGAVRCVEDHRWKMNLEFSGIPNEEFDRLSVETAAFRIASGKARDSQAVGEVVARAEEVAWKGEILASAHAEPSAAIYPGIDPTWMEAQDNSEIRLIDDDEEYEAIRPEFEASVELQGSQASSDIVEGADTTTEEGSSAVHLARLDESLDPIGDLRPRNETGPPFHGSAEARSTTYMALASDEMEVGTESEKSRSVEEWSKIESEFITVVKLRAGLRASSATKKDVKNPLRPRTIWKGWEYANIHVTIFSIRSLIPIVLIFSFIFAFYRQFGAYQNANKFYNSSKDRSIETEELIHSPIKQSISTVIPEASVQEREAKPDPIAASISEATPFPEPRKVATFLVRPDGSFPSRSASEQSPRTATGAQVTPITHQTPETLESQNDQPSQVLASLRPPTPPERPAPPPQPTSAPDRKPAGALSGALASTIPLGQNSNQIGQNSIVFPPASASVLGSWHTFNCSKANLSVDYVICSNPQLIALGSTLADTYHSVRSAISNEDSRKQLGNDQFAWSLKFGPNCGLPKKGQPSQSTVEGTKACVAQAIQERISYLKGLSAAD